MTQKTKCTILLFFICLVLIPAFIYVTNTKKMEERQAVTAERGEKILSGVSVFPREVKLPEDATEDMLKEKLEVKALYKKDEPSEVVYDYTTDFNRIKTHKGMKKITIKVSQNGCTKKAIVCVDFIKPTPTPEVPNPPTQKPAAPAEQINFPYISGYPDKTFKPDQAVTREEMATMLARLISKNQIPKEANQFKDLSAARFSTDAANYITKLGIMKPKSQDLFDPNAPVTDAEFKDIVMRANAYIKNPEVALPTGGDLTRAEAVAALNKLFNVKCSESFVDSPFKDVSTSNPYYKDIVCATQSRIEAR